MIQEIQRRSPASMALVVLLAAIASLVSSAVWITFYKYQPLWVEHAAYGMTANVTFADSLAADGYWHALWSALAERHPLQPAVLAAVSPQLLAWPHSHVLVTAATFFLFLCLLAHYAIRRTASVYWGTAVVVLFCSLTGLYSERQGMAVPWPDFQSMFLLSAAVLALALYAVERTVSWFVVAGALIVLATLARDTGAIWSALVCGPILLTLIAADRRRYGWRTALARVSYFAAAALPAVILFARHLSFFRSYYMTANQWQLRQPLGTAASHMLNDLLLFFGPAAAVVVSVLLACAIWRGASTWQVADFAVVYWPASIALFLFANGYAATDVTKEIMYVAPGVVCAAFTVRGGVGLHWRPMVNAALIACVIVAGVAAVHSYNTARTPTPQDAELRASQYALADALSSIPQRVWWHSYSLYDWGTPVAALTYFDGHYQPTENQLFYNHRNYWDSHFPGMNQKQIEEFIIRQTEDRVDVAVVLKHPDVKPQGMEDYSFAIASSIANYVQSSPRWRHYRDLQTIEGPLALFINLHRAAGNPTS